MRKKNTKNTKNHKKMTRYQKAAIIVAILAVLLSFALSFNRFVALDSHLNLTAEMQIENLAGWVTVPIDFHYLLFKRAGDTGSMNVVVDAEETIDLVTIAVPVPNTNKHTVTLDRDFFIPKESGIGAYIFESDIYHQGQQQRVTRFSVIVLPFLLYIFFTYDFLVLLLIISLILSSIGLWKRWRERRRAERLYQQKRQRQAQRL